MTKADLLKRLPGFVPRAIDLRIRTLRRFKLAILPYAWLSPVLKFKRDGWNDRIYNSITSIEPPNVVIFGGYLGDSANSWLSKWPEARVDIFEPVEQYAASIQKRFDGSNAFIHPFGIGARQEKRFFCAFGDATFGEGVHRDGFEDPYETLIPVNFMAIHDLRGVLPSFVDILEINIEGGEYELIPLLSNHGFLSHSENIFIQFHSIGDVTDQRIALMREELIKTHEPIWNYHLVWEYWRLRGA